MVVSWCYYKNIPDAYQHGLCISCYDTLFNMFDHCDLLDTYMIGISESVKPAWRLNADGATEGA